MLGTFGVGKTSLVKRFVYDLFSDKYLSTIGIQLHHKILDSRRLGSDTYYLNLLLWDIANIEKFTPVIKNYFKGASGAIIVVDLTRPNSFDSHQIHIDEFLKESPGAKLIFVGNKSDLVDSKNMGQEKLQALAANYHTPYILTSAKTGNNVEVLFTRLGKLLLD